MHRNPFRLLTVTLLALVTAACAAKVKTTPLPAGFVYVEQVVPAIKIDLRYYTPHNFIGTPIDGYRQPRCILTRQAAEALKMVQRELEPFGLSLKIFDAYRPQRAVDHFVRWAKDLSDQRMKQEFYPGVDKRNLFKEDYIAARSSHSRGSTVDLTITSLQAAPNAAGIDMGSRFDFFGPESWPYYSGITADQRAHRMLLNQLMIKHGFQPYPKEWWHFTLVDEPFPDTYFDFPVQ